MGFKIKYGEFIYCFKIRIDKINNVTTSEYLQLFWLLNRSYIQNLPKIACLICQNVIILWNNIEAR